MRGYGPIWQDNEVEGGWRGQEVVRLEGSPFGKIMRLEIVRLDGRGDSEAGTIGGDRR